MSRMFLVAAVGLCAACKSSFPSDSDPTPHLTFADTRGFPAQKLDGLVYGAARWDERHDEVFGVDLVRTADVLPIAMTVQLRGAGQDEARAWLNPERMGAELVLADGTTLPALPARAVAARVAERHGERVERRALATGLLSSRGEEGWLYFDLAGHDELDVDDACVERSVDGRTRRLLLDQSLVTFDVTLDGREQPFCVGIGR
ncbi:MAG: hypothetical protein HZA52_16045 [Planctomycetes bacterium]|nr:hypothetical protein [Planctomycetota bacterium]